MKVQGVIIPLLTPFKDGKIDFKSYERMVNHYIDEGVSGIIPLGTTGESPTILCDEYEEVLSKTMEYNNNRVQVYTGLGGNHTSEVVKKLKIAERNRVNGILSVAPYYSRPNQRGLYEHFKNISQSTDLDIIIYNIPYRTGTNVENETIFRLAELKNIIGIKDCSGNIKQTADLLINRPKDFSILTGEDAYFYTTLTLGGDGGIMASASLRTREFIEVYNLVKENNHQAALEKWRDLYNMIPLLFAEPNPTPLKYCLKKLNLIDSDEVRLPMVNITSELESRLDNILI
ncbi:4-hydroxy-tetrahydrodipicolinate synthase [Clostridium saccharobutylicum]|uniref:4-hydroxy-tetrahydrodipicolinate synthase n=1 Tax=Clostridium saccharobutylicum DSM 13864 TaxID=1345695 RepID=U5MXC4_CLOSA|nr:4-hydroxy-tetrahydrodipicolinate synthase [Clostridium saccharobutylicum]AGX45414.1 4-hydroxy-tetrahydrodipicolinate synthase 2 [Clostridium saccharobutylicum DSM 13864]AQR92688.1 4-hydroxy-tetrahydrodipicolinate synthase [Clostridium saccharobutylicum]AQS02590.1 4-hydroxy-tetrahydrodipicolinate synthase [Clostridium saccharobutylicum]AQS12196.1 4-hydroxy-tetrahydrodipicolinate synthase [Clostridium saccharobutylicum]AQS16573.1 4-hydroxy-tetrahydrodipicolinate synthase [Clostridium saccharo